LFSTHSQKHLLLSQAQKIKPLLVPGNFIPYVTHSKISIYQTVFCAQSISMIVAPTVQKNQERTSNAQLKITIKSNFSISFFLLMLMLSSIYVFSLTESSSYHMGDKMNFFLKELIPALAPLTA